MIHKFSWMVILLILVGCAGSRVSPVPAPEQGNPLVRAMELNRKKDWEKAAQVIRHWLEHEGDAAPLLARCEALFQLAYATTHMEHMEVALDTLHQFDQHCREIPETHWLRREVDQLRPPTVVDDGFWQVADGASLGMDAGALAAHQQLCEQTGADACLVVHKRRLVQEWYAGTYRAPAPAMSSTKSITGLLVGMLLDDGKIKSLDEPVCTFLPEWCSGSKREVTLRHLLTMTSGLPTTQEGGVGTVSDKNAYVIGLTPAHQPGKVWAYSNEGVQLLSPILDAVAGEPIAEYARKRLFEPLGMKDTRLRLDQANHAWTYADMDTTPRDLARIGLLMLQKGMWDNQRVISEGWVEAATGPSQDLNKRYGLLWWLYENPKGFAALGYLDTNLYVFPNLDLLIVRMQRKPSGSSHAENYERRALPLFEKMVKTIR